MSDHPFLTRLAIQSLPQQDRSIWHGHEERLIDDYCKWPDAWFDLTRHDEIAPYQLVIDGLQFHYPPPSRRGYHWTMIQTPLGPRPQPMPEENNRFWPFMREGISYYLSEICRSLHDGHVDDAAKRLGILLHVFQDTHHLHALEGPWGADFFVLDDVMPWPDGDRLVSPTSLLLEVACREGDLTGHRPQLEGTTIAEAVFRLQARYVRTSLANRSLHVPLVQAQISGNNGETRRLLKQINETIAQLCADVIHTVTSLAAKRFDDIEVIELKEFALDPIIATQRPWFLHGAYGVTGIVPNACIDAERRRHPLQLRFPDGSRQSFTAGWGSGAHVEFAMAFEIPADVYARLTLHLGLHDPLGTGGAVEVEVRHNRRPVAGQRVDESSPTMHIDLPASAGGEVRFVVRETEGSSPDRNNLVWANPKLSK